MHFRRERYIPRGGPDGGDGGSGGSVILVADPAVETFNLLRSFQVYKAEAGKGGGGEGMHGHRGADLEVRVPVGTIISIDAAEAGGEPSEIDVLKEPGARHVIVHGGRGGRGNKHFATSINQTPKFAEQGFPGEEGVFHLMQGSAVDVVIVGFPNAGKSSLLAACTHATPKIGNYPFTTIVPETGVLERNYEQLTLEELPGLPEDAAEGSALSETVRSHGLRATVLLHIVSGENDDVVERIQTFKGLLDALEDDLSQKIEAIVVSKIDLPEVHEKIPALKKALTPFKLPVYFVSAMTGAGVPELIDGLFPIVEAARAVDEEERSAGERDEHMQEFRPGENEWGALVRKLEDGVFSLEGPTVPVLVVNRNTSKGELEMYVRERLRRSRWRQRLERAGVKSGDKVWVGEVELEW